MKVGRLRHRIEIQKLFKKKNAVGELSPCWETTVTRWGSIDPLRGDELVAAAKIEARTSHKIVMRWTDELTSTVRFRFEGRIFNPVEIRNFREVDHFAEIIAFETDDA